MDRIIESAVSAPAAPVSPAALLERAQRRLPAIRTGDAINGVVLREVLRAAYEAARLEPEFARAEERQEDPRYLAFLGQVYLLAQDTPSAVNCWLRAATLGDAESLARLAQYHTAPERALLYAGMYRARSDARAVGVCANLLRLLATEETVSALARRLFEEALLWNPDPQEQVSLLDFAIAAELFDQAEGLLQQMASRGDDVFAYRAYLDHRRQISNVKVELTQLAQQAQAQRSLYRMLEEKALAAWQHYEEPIFGATYMFALGARDRLPADVDPAIPALQEESYNLLVAGLVDWRRGQRDQAAAAWQKVRAVSVPFWSELAEYYLRKNGLAAKG